MKILPLSTLITLAWRNLWRHYRRTLVMLAAVTVGVWAMVFMTALSRGMVDDMVQSGLQTLLGHVQIHHHEYRDDPAITNTLPEPGGELLRGLDATGNWTARLRVPGVISSERETRGLVLVGIEPQSEARLSFIASSIVSGSYLDSADQEGVLIGAKLAEELETGLGKRIVVMSQNPDNEIADRGFRVVGIYSADLESVEEQFVFMGMRTAQKLLNVEGRVSEIELIGEDYRNTQPLVDSLAPLIDENSEILRWDQIDTYLGTMVSVMDGYVVVWILIVFAALSFGLVNTLAMAVFERVREIGLMLALGMKPLSIWLLVVMEALMLLGLGLLSGNLLAWITIRPLEGGIDVSSVAEGMAIAGYGSVIYPALYVSDMLLATVVVLVLGILASALPAWRASRLQPVRALTSH